MNLVMKEHIGETLLPILAPFHQVDGCPLKSVWETYVDNDLEAIHLEFETGFLSIVVDGSDDTVELSLSPNRPDATCVSDLRPWRSNVGKSFGWGWISVNQQGYLDGVSFSFGAVIPQLNITAIASSLRLSQVQTIARRRSNRSEKEKEPAFVSLAMSA